MTQWILTSSLLIAVVLLIRKIAGDRLSARVRYALWGLVLLRLLIPVSIGESALSVQNWLPDEADIQQLQTMPAEQQAQLDQIRKLEEQVRDSEQSVSKPVAGGEQAGEALPGTEFNHEHIPDEPIAHTEPRYTMTDYLLTVWVTGMALVGSVFLLSNLRFWLRLRRSRRYVMKQTVPVYETAAIDTPCLFGVVPAVYVTPAVLGDENALRHVLAHELTHYGHGDHIWALLRCVAVTVHWYNPLVWAAAFASQKDGELACDEGALKKLGDGERTGYARTLLDMTCVGYKGVLTAATSMTGSESDLKTRVLRIVKNPKMTVTALVAVLVVAAVVAVMLFTGQPKQELEGTWYGQKYETTGTCPDYKYLLGVEVLFYDGKARVYEYHNGEMYLGRDANYTAKNGDLRVVNEFYDMDDTYTYTWQGDDSIVLYGANGLELIELSMKTPEESLLVPDAMMDILAIEDLTKEPAWAADEATIRWHSPFIVSALQRGEIKAVVDGQNPSAPMVAYIMTVKEHGKEKQLLFADGVLYKDGVGYLLSTKEELEEQLQQVGSAMQPKDGFTDEYGLRYYTLGTIFEDTAALLYIPMQHEYYENRFYMPENGKDWQRAWMRAVANRREGDAEAYRYTATETIFNMQITDTEGNWEFVNVYPDGTVEYTDWVNDMDGTSHPEEYHILPEDAPELVELLQPYLRLYAESEKKGADQQRIAGAWRLVEGTGHGGVTDLKAVLCSGQRYDAFSNAPGCWLSATKDGCVLETEFYVYIENNQMHIRWTDGEEQVVSCKLDGQWLTLYGEDGTWVLHQEDIGEMPVVADLIRLSRADYENSLVHLDLSDEKLDELESLLRQGMVKRDNNFIAVDEVYYKVIGLEEAFRTEDLTITDYGTVHLNGESYDLTNWTEVKGFFDSLYKKIP